VTAESQKVHQSHNWLSSSGQIESGPLITKMIRSHSMLANDLLSPFDSFVTPGPGQ
jgi:hypothetical protein